MLISTWLLKLKALHESPKAEERDGTWGTIRCLLWQMAKQGQDN